MTRRSRMTGLATPITPGNVARRLGSRLATSAMEGLVNAVPYGRTAVNAARIIQSAYRGYKSRAATKKQQSAPYRRYYQFGGKYAGRFKKPVKSSKVSLPKKLGIVLSHEEYGAVKDPDMVILGHHTFPNVLLSRAIAIATVRKVLKSAINFDGENVDKEIPVTNYNDALGGTLVFVFKNGATGSILVQNASIINDDTISTVCNKPCTGDITSSIVTTFNKMLTNQSGFAFLELERVIYKVLDRVLCDLNMFNQVIKLSVSSQLKLQNRTFAASATTGDADRVDSQPIKGKLLNFAGVPKPKGTVGTELFAFDETTNSMFLMRGAQCATQEPLVKQDFTNCFASTNVYLQPGDIKSTKIAMNKGFYFNNLFKSMQGLLETANSKFTKIPGQSQLFLFEELLNSGSTNPIHVQYEQQLYIGAYLISGKATSIKTVHTQTEYNNVPA